ncbi:MAG: molybdopterin-dependent oxidoreductase, partial [bacterium]
MKTGAQGSSEKGAADTGSSATMSTEKTWRNQDPIELDGVEVREYQGERLSLINQAFRENSIRGPQYVDKDEYVLKIEVPGIESSGRDDLTLSYNEVLAYPAYEKVVTLYCVEGWDAKILWEGVRVKDLPGFSVAAGGTGDASGKVVKFFAADGYSTSLPLDFVLENDLLLAYKMNGVTLPEERGFPFQLVAEDKWGYKWIKWVTRIRVD